MLQLDINRRLIKLLTDVKNVFLINIMHELIVLALLALSYMCRKVSIGPNQKKTFFVAEDAAGAFASSCYCYR